MQLCVGVIPLKDMLPTFCVIRFTYVQGSKNKMQWLELRKVTEDCCFVHMLSAIMRFSSSKPFQET